MCGIAGAVGRDHQSDETTSAVAAMLSGMQRRGPDGEGVERWPGVTFGHRRLAILDLSDAGRQPMLSDDRRVGVVFNGCIYNFQELRAELIKAGCAFHSQCDTEVLVHGYRVWGGMGLAKRIWGMYAFAVWDEPEQKLTLVRDRLGVKPLVYAERNGMLGFASTVQALRTAGLTGEVDPGAAAEFLHYGFVSDEHSIYSGVHKLPPATLLEWKNGNSTQQTYWSLSDPAPEARLNFEEAVERTEQLLIDAVRIRLQADVPIGALLSGGIDSTLVCWALTKLNADIRSFTVATPGHEADEAGAAAETARILGIRHEIVSLPDACDSVLDNIAEAWSEPFGPHSAQGMLLVSEAVRKSATVLLTGDGGDDCFLGYPFMKHALLAERTARLLPPGSASFWRMVRPIFPGSGNLRRLRSFLDFSTGGLGGLTRAGDAFAWLRERSVPGELFAGVPSPAEKELVSHESAKRLLTDVLARHRRLHFLSEFLPKVDGGTMYHSLEARSPFLDHRMWELAASLPFSMRLKGGVLKAILRTIVHRHVGEATATRAKQGFTIPVEQLLVTKWRDQLEALASDNTMLRRQGWVSRGSLVPVVRECLEKGHAPLQMYRLVIAERWLNHASSGVRQNDFARTA